MRVIQGGGGSVEAASANIIVVDNNQVVSIDQSSSMATITKTSEVVVRNSSATSGYVLSAKLLPTSSDIPNSTVKISSPSSLLCQPTSPCTLDPPASASTQAIGNLATTDATNIALGHTTVWTVAITVPANTDLGNYLVDIEYSEEAILDLTTISTMQAVTQTLCDNSIGGLTVSLRDTRDNKSYRVRKMVDGRCWMVENLAYDIGAASGRPSYNPTAQLMTNGASSLSSRAQYIANTGYNSADGQVTYLYNWCAALGDTSASCAASASAVEHQTVINGLVVTGTAINQPDVTGICPEPFRLPKGGPEASSNDSSTTANEYAKLDIAMGGSGTNRDDEAAYLRWTGVGISDVLWESSLGGGYENAFIFRGVNSYYLSSTASMLGDAFRFNLYSEPKNVRVAGGVSNGKIQGFSVRCVF